MTGNPLTNYIRWLTTQLNELRSSMSKNYFYKIVGEELCKESGEKKLVIQVAGKNVYIRLTPNQIILDEMILRGFSQLDVRSITFMACKSEYEPKRNQLYRVIAQFFSKNRKEEMFIIQLENDAIQLTKSAQEISNDFDLINKFHPHDAHRIGYVTGAEQMVAEADFLIDK